MDMMEFTWHIHIQGQVQGVGFRPFVFRKAKKLHLSGGVKNAGDGVHIEFNADHILAEKFYNSIINEHPVNAHITSHSLVKTIAAAHADFTIISSDKGINNNLLLSPDVSVCKFCADEISDPTNRRYNYAFATCTECGPRYSIIKDLPYDRENTNMSDFKMCPACTTEYNDPLNRRYYSQTNSCLDCGVSMNLHDHHGKIIEADQTKILDEISTALKNGKIIAVKGIGGYHLICDAYNANVIRDLRIKKMRPHKPFAVMYADVVALEKDVLIHDTERMFLQSTAAPIMIFPRRKSDSPIQINEIAPGLHSLGVLLPYSPFYLLLLQKFVNPIVVTSANRSKSSLIFEDKVALLELHKYASQILINDREIAVPQDDSVMTCSPHYKAPIVLRRARGFAPLYKDKTLKTPLMDILSLGSSLKSCFTLTHRRNIHISQYAGDTDNFEIQEYFQKNLDLFLKLFQSKPEIILTDKHPDYFTSRLGIDLAKEWHSKLFKIQHHEAHLCSVIGEHGLVHTEDRLLGVVWDGTGLGDDGHIWGGEFFIYENYSIIRADHFSYFDHFLGDKMAVEPRLSAFSLCYDNPEAQSILRSKFSETEWLNYHKLIRVNKLKTSSVGRIFDAVASLAGLSDKTSYEGHAALLLESQAQLFFNDGLNIPVAWMQLPPEVSPKHIINRIVEQLQSGASVSAIAAWFHVQLVLMIRAISVKNNCTGICCSGGVFQNGLLVDLVIKIMGEDFQLYFNKDLSPNDENISFGQLTWYCIALESSQ